MTSRRVPLPVVAPDTVSPTSASTIVLDVTGTTTIPVLLLVALAQEEVLKAPPVICSIHLYWIYQGSVSPESMIPIVYSTGVSADITEPSSICPVSSKRSAKAE